MLYAVPFAAMTDHFFVQQTAWSELYNFSQAELQPRLITKNMSGAKQRCYTAFAASGSEYGHQLPYTASFTLLVQLQ